MESSHPEHPGARGEERTGAGREKRGGARGLTLRTASSVSIAELKTKSALFCQRMGCASVSAPHVLCPRRVCGVRWSVECGVWSVECGVRSGWTGEGTWWGKIQVCSPRRTLFHMLSVCLRRITGTTARHVAGVATGAHMRTQRARKSQCTKQPFPAARPGAARDTCVVPTLPRWRTGSRTLP